MKIQFPTRKQTIFFLCIVLLTPYATHAQKKPLDHSVYDGWQSIGASGISPDGHFIYYTITPQEGDAQLIITTPDQQHVQKIDRGTQASFSADKRFLVALIKPFFSETREARIKKKKPDEMPKDSLAIVNLETAALAKVARVTSYKVPEETSEYIAYISESPSAAPDTTKTDTTRTGEPPRKKPVPILHIQHLPSGEEMTFERVDTYYFNKAGTALVFVRNAAEKDSIGADAGLYYYDLATHESHHISRGKGVYKNIAFDEPALQLAFTADKSPEKSLRKAFKLYYYVSRQHTQDTAIVIADARTNGIPPNWYISGEGNVRFSKNGEKLFFGIAPVPRIKDTTLVEFEHANVDIWHWKDDYLQTQQLVNLRREQNRSYLAVTYPQQGRRVIPLADEQLPEVRLTYDADNEFALGTTDVGRRIETQWVGGSFQDIYAVSTTDGSRKKVAENIRGSIALSPTGRYITWFNRSDSSWYSHTLSSGSTVRLNSDLPVSFADEDNDVPDEPNGYGIAGWSADDEEVFINDKYDIWGFSPDGTQRRILTNGAGRSNQITFRYTHFPEDAGSYHGQRKPIIIDLKKPLILSAFNHTNKESGWYTGNGRNRRDPREIVMGPFRYHAVQKATEAENYLYTKENYVCAPDLYTTPDFSHETQLSHINPQQATYNWGTAAYNMKLTQRRADSAVAYLVSKGILPSVWSPRDMALRNWPTSAPKELNVPKKSISGTDGWNFL